MERGRILVKTPPKRGFLFLYFCGYTVSQKQKTIYEIITTFQ